jgi:hypothetical protein
MRIRRTAGALTLALAGWLACGGPQSGGPSSTPPGDDGGLDAHVVSEASPPHDAAPEQEAAPPCSGDTGSCLNGFTCCAGLLCAGNPPACCKPCGPSGPCCLDGLVCGPQDVCCSEIGPCFSEKECCSGHCSGGFCTPTDGGAPVDSGRDSTTD